MIYIITITAMSKISNLYNAWDIKYFRWIHKQKQLAMWREYVSYTQFRKRLQRGMTLRDAIYSPCVIHQRRMHKPKHPISDNIRRRATLMEENVHIPSLDDLVAIENLKPIQPKQAKPTLRNRFLNLFK